MQLKIKFHASLSISFCASADTKFMSHTDRLIDRQFLKIVRLCSKHPKTCKSVKNRESKIFTIPILFFFVKRGRWAKLLASNTIVLENFWTIAVRKFAAAEAWNTMVWNLQKL